MILLALALLAAEPKFEVVISEAALQELLVAAVPITQTTEQDVLGKKVKLNIELTNPVVSVGRARIVVTLDYHVKDDGGLIDTKGLARPELEIRAVPERKVFEAKLVKAGVKLAGGIEVPLERYVQPIILPGTSTQEVSVAGKTVIIETIGREVALDTGIVRLLGITKARPKEATPPRR